ncbi:MAG: hypothetical protein BWY09_01669 [Candidatus Hydrogenedentes bacterium ADurb.Bin179]|nr:MAG: hypothetical protein BWY09_01669 [Candidatus Hydrogenedentes bacterium ADurb.Bin179]
MPDEDQAAYFRQRGLKHGTRAGNGIDYGCVGTGFMDFCRLFRCGDPCYRQHLDSKIRFACEAREFRRNPVNFISCRLFRLNAAPGFPGCHLTPDGNPVHEHGLHPQRFAEPEMRPVRIPQVFRPGRRGRKGARGHGCGPGGRQNRGNAQKLPSIHAALTHNSLPLVIIDAVERDA